MEPLHPPLAPRGGRGSACRRCSLLLPIPPGPRTPVGTRITHSEGHAPECLRAAGESPFKLFLRVVLTIPIKIPAEFLKIYMKM